ncbi:flagellar hook-associated protein FlgL [Vibrio sp. MACH09]|uniref:flagellar hook-associated protein FlgL n=1 Tax=unclassified Vibrio TaxID=2614977 RepID=UPI001493C679|nr:MULTISPECIES: flagellar hook-associated protein FlgL [unclassified Vibrio]NOI68157.1 flagellar hook-associated protein FlgL [Vibrio sp. 99-8-1]GLO61570.1 flagellar hook-associated protein FlgL [Vibrio sp. MACH09]
MVGRITSFHNFQSVQNDLRRQENKVFHNQAQLASGKKLLNASDDPLATHYIQSIGQQSEQLRQYMDAIVLVRNRLEHHEVLVANSEDYADKAKRTVMEMINGSHSPEDRMAKTRELKEISNNLLTLANSQDESGNYIFAGTKPKNQPFFRDNEGNVSYAGDDYQRKMKISNQLEMPTNDPGSKMYMQVDNPFGDYQPSYQLQTASELLLERATNLDYADNSSYRITFVDMGTGKFGYQLEQDGSVVQADVFDPAKGIKFEDLSIQLKGQITAGDTISLEPRKTFSIFESFKDAIDLSETSVSDSSATAALHRITKEFDAAFVHLGKARTDVGARMNTLDIQKDLHLDFKLTLAKSQSAFEDLDYSQAVIDFNENSIALEASQKAFGKTKDLTLFNYI